MGKGEKMKARIKAIFDSKYQENGIICYFDVDEIAQNPQRFSNPINDKYGTIGITGFRDDWNTNWSKGELVSFELIEQESKGKTYLNFRQPSQEPKGDILEEILETVTTNQKLINKLLDTADEDIPF